MENENVLEGDVGWHNEFGPNKGFPFLCFVFSNPSFRTKLQIQPKFKYQTSKCTSRISA
jgi:hypothetical protein